MTIPHPKMYHEAHILFEALKFLNKEPRKSLRQLNEEYYPQAGGLLENIKAAVLRYRLRLQTSRNL
jgi:hypothetical protein